MGGEGGGGGQGGEIMLRLGVKLGFLKLAPRWRHGPFAASPAMNSSDNKAFPPAVFMRGLAGARVALAAGREL